MSQITHCPISYEELLNFYKESGADTALTDTPVNHFHKSHSAENEVKQISDISHNKQTLSSLEQKSTSSYESDKMRFKDSIEEMVKNIKTLDELKSALLSFDGCSLKLTAKNTCFSDGTAGSPLMLIGEAPGREEDIQGIPFVGRAGMLLNKILASIGLTRENVYIANTIPWRPPGNRTPTPREIALCRPFIERQIQLANPRVLVALGGTAVQFFTGTQSGIIRMRGKWLTYETADNIKIPVMPTFHPAYLLRTPSQKKLTWTDFLEVKSFLSNLT
ncbi:uracil-DNA glycosylase [Bartonella ancashensis]|uniref:Type-4 uracil-DNA glycosylase n=1 Tax=Bartonella ancashensis TaxID=1318743 RepID=A0A0M4L8Z0_9HYPH|nr:uracil-DNA glycosylase [Bartonella ancashensis]ALE04026.1 Uracil-DNA glycosylase, family 4 [Bartonella ancashensis]